MSQIEKKTSNLEEMELAVSNSKSSRETIIKGRIQYLLKGNRKVSSTLTKGIKTSRCPNCGEVLSVVKKKSLALGFKCWSCESVLHLHNKVYYTTSFPQERLMIYNWEYTNPDFDIAIFNSNVNTRELMAKYQNLSVSFVKNEAWSANK